MISYGLILDLRRVATRGRCGATGARQAGQYSSGRAAARMPRTAPEAR